MESGKTTTISQETADFIKAQEVIKLDDIVFVRKEYALKLFHEFFKTMSFWKLLHYWWQEKRGKIKLDFK